MLTDIVGDKDVEPELLRKEVSHDLGVDLA
jgi:hypothetical protein